ncbi:MAG: hypothetical protein H0X37_24930 [Herpetosiphonaceae bacterium]|nr:hypothetical protein [Herpetosiphonaceae bacterium]
MPILLYVCHARSDAVAHAAVVFLDDALRLGIHALRPRSSSPSTSILPVGVEATKQRAF